MINTTTICTMELFKNGQSLGVLDVEGANAPDRTGERFRSEPSPLAVTGPYDVVLSKAGQEILRSTINRSLVKGQSLLIDVRIRAFGPV